VKQGDKKMAAKKKKTYKITKADFKAFKVEATRLQTSLGLLEYDLCFEFTPMRDQGPCWTMARLEVTGTSASLTLNSEYEDPDKVDPELEARHEMTHLLLRKLMDIGEDRYADEGDLYRENERLTVKLTRLLVEV